MKREATVPKLKKEKPSSPAGQLMLSAKAVWQPGPGLSPPQGLESL